MNWKYILAAPNILQVFQQPFLLLFLQILEWNDKYENCSLDLSLPYLTTNLRWNPKN